MATINKVIVNDYYESYGDALQDMTNQSVKHLGWLNGGIKIPDRYTFKEVYSNYTGTMCLYCDIIHRVAYSVDMGD